MSLTSYAEEERKVCATALPKLHISSTSGPTSALHALADLVAEALDGRTLVSDATARNAVVKFQTALGKVLPAESEEGGQEEEEGGTAADEDGVAATSSEGSTPTAQAAGKRAETMSPLQKAAMDQTEVEAEADEEEIEETMTQLNLQFTGVPDAEGTVMGDFGEDDEEDVGEGEDSLVESLLEDSTL